MARNLALLIFLCFSLFLIRSARSLWTPLVKRRGKRPANPQDFKEKALFILYFREKKRLPPLFFYLNFASVSATVLSLLLSLSIGWFSFSALLMKILVTVALLSAAAYATLTRLVKNKREFQCFLFLYRDRADGEGLPFASSVLDGCLYLLAPLVLAISGFWL